MEVFVSLFGTGIYLHTCTLWYILFCQHHVDGVRRDSDTPNRVAPLFTPASAEVTRITEKPSLGTSPWIHDAVLAIDFLAPSAEEHTSPQPAPEPTKYLIPLHCTWP